MARKEQQHAAGAGARPLVAIVGRPNVGKSTLFNRLAAERVALVEDVPGVTRDRIYTVASALGREYLLVDTGGFDPESDDPLSQRIAAQVRIAIEEADLVLCVFDGTVEPLPADREAARLLRESNRPVLYVANKIDNAKRSLLAKELYRLGIDELHEVAALHGRGIGALEDEMVAALPEASSETVDDDAIPRIAIVGRPNAGKSSLVNRWLGEERQIVDARPGTTVDSVDSVIERDGWRAVIVDTAGMRRRRSVSKGIEALSVMRALRAIEQCHTALLLIDAQRGPAEQDARIAGLAIERGRALVVGLNKIDLIDADARKAAERATRDLLSFAPWAPLCRISAKTGRGTGELLRQVRTTTERRGHRVGTAEANRFFAEVLERHPPPTSGNQSVRLYYIAQVTTHPPTFVISTNHPDRIARSYTRYVSNQLRERFAFGGTPIRVRYRSHHARKDD